MNERKRKILAAIVEQYIATGEPIGSKTLSNHFDMMISSATIRNEMSELCEMGYLEQPHTSAGRIPSNNGYRYYVDHLMNRHPLTDLECAKIECMLNYNSTDPAKLLENASKVLADLTNCVSVFTTPADTNASIRKVELIQASKKTAILIMLTSSGILKNCVCRIDIDIDDTLRDAFYNVVSEYFIGASVVEASSVRLQTLASSLGEKNYALEPLFMALSELTHDAARAEIMLDGQTNLLSHRDYYNDVYELMDFLRGQEQLSKLISYRRDEHKDTLSILIGSENYFRELETSSMILARYSLGSHEIGTLGIIGPTRLDYAKLIPNVEYLTQLVGRLLTETLDDE